MIEGRQASLSDLLLFELNMEPGVPMHDVWEVNSYVAPLAHGLKRLAEGFPLPSSCYLTLMWTPMSRGY